MRDSSPTGQEMEDSRTPPARIGVLGLLVILLRRKRFLFVSMGIISVGAVVLSLLLPQEYRATAVIMPPKDKLPSSFGALGADLPIQSLLESVGLSGGSSTDQFLSILESRRLAEKVIDRFSLISYWGFRKKRKFYFEDILRQYYEVVRVEEDDLGKIHVSVRDTSPTLAAQMANFMVRQLDTIVLDLSQEAAGHSRRFFRERLDSVKNDLDSVHQVFSQFKTEHSYIDLDAQLDATVEAVSKLQSRALATDFELAILRDRFGSQNPQVRELKSKRASMRRKLRQITQQGNGDLIIALRNVPELSVEYAYLYRDVKVKESLYLLTLQLYERARFEEIQDIPSVQLLEEARVPQKKVWPIRSLLCILIFMGGFVLTTLAILIQRWYHIQAAQDTRAYHHLREIVSHFRRSK